VTTWLKVEVGALAELVYPPVIALAKTMFRALDMRISIEGSDHIPTSGGVVLACNHVSYLDFIFCGLGALPSKRLVRFMAKKSVFDSKLSGPLMRGMHHIPVDRDAGAASYEQAVRALRAGEAVGVFPEATISRSFMIKELKSGAGRMAAEAGVPIIPVALWGTQRFWTKSRPRNLTQRHIPILMSVGQPIRVRENDNPDAVTIRLRSRLQAMVDRLQTTYPDKPSGPGDTWWLPANLGGTAPTLAEAPD
jgi:1-acyl-sn-glycerol-3-phosphate acyltransferase